MSQPSPKYEWFYNIWKKCLSYLSMKKRVVYFIVIFIVISLSLWSVGPFLLKPAEIIAIRSTVVKPIHPDSKGRCRIWDSKRLICLPNVFLLGASKTGTTSWFNYLIHHPNVTYVKRRTTSSRQASQEVHRFDNPWFHFYPKRVSRSMEWAASPLVQHINTSIIHYTPQYLYAPSVPYDVHKFYPHPADMKFIIILRNPVDRALSSYWFKNSKIFTKNKEDRGSISDFMKNFKKEKKRRHLFEECLADNDLYTPHRKASLLTRKELSANFDNLEKCFGADFRHPKLGLRHIDKGIYNDQLDRWLQNFHMKQFMIIFYEDWILNPLKSYKEVLEFMGQDLNGPYGFHSPVELKQMLKRRYGVVKNSKKQELPDNLRRQVECFYQPYNVDLAETLGRKNVYNSSTLSCP